MRLIYIYSDEEILTQTQKIMSQTVDNPKCMLGHTLSKVYASCLKTNIQCTECEEFIFNKEEYWKCGCCSYPYELCVKCCYDTVMIKDTNKKDKIKYNDKINEIKNEFVYGYSYMHTDYWSIPEKREPICKNLKPCKICPRQTTGFKKDLMKWNTAK